LSTTGRTQTMHSSPAARADSVAAIVGEVVGEVGEVLSPPLDPDLRWVTPGVSGCTSVHNLKRTMLAASGITTWSVTVGHEEIGCILDMFDALMSHSRCALCNTRSPFR
jgi:hypothetical protein